MCGKASIWLLSTWNIPNTIDLILFSFNGFEFKWLPVAGGSQIGHHGIQGFLPLTPSVQLVPIFPLRYSLSSHLLSLSQEGPQCLPSWFACFSSVWNLFLVGSCSPVRASPNRHPLPSQPFPCLTPTARQNWALFTSVSLFPLLLLQFTTVLQILMKIELCAPLGTLRERTSLVFIIHHLVH